MNIQSNDDLSIHPAKLQDQLRLFIESGGDISSFEAGQIIWRYLWNESVDEQLTRPCSVQAQCCGPTVEESGYKLGGMPFNRL
jgi:hypothetical protein